MEKHLEKHMTNTLNNHGVVGILCADQNGLCIGVKGPADPKHAGTLAAIGREAEKILPNSEPPVISIETSSMNILIKSKDGYTTAIYKQA